MTKRKSLILSQIEKGFKKNIELYRKVRCFSQRQETGERKHFTFTPEHYIRSFNRTTRDNFLIQRQCSLSLPSYFLFLDIYYELIESGLIGFNFPKNNLIFFLLGDTCAVIAKVGHSSYCQIAHKKIRRDVCFIVKDKLVSSQELEEWSAKELLEIKIFNISSTGVKVPIEKNQPIKENTYSKFYLIDEDIFINLGNTNFVGFS